MENSKVIRRWTVGKELAEGEEKKEKVLALSESTRLGKGLYWVAFTQNNHLYDFRNPPRRADDFQLKKINELCFSFYVDFLLTGRVQFLTRAERETINL